jgi:hypothetical protein
MDFANGRSVDGFWLGLLTAIDQYAREFLCGALQITHGRERKVVEQVECLMAVPGFPSGLSLSNY